MVAYRRRILDDEIIPPYYLYNQGEYSNGLNDFQVKGYMHNSYSRQKLEKNSDNIYWYMTQSVQFNHTLSSTTSVNLSGKTKLHILADWTATSPSTRGWAYFGIASNIVSSQTSVKEALPNRIESTKIPASGTGDTIVSNELILNISNCNYLDSAWLYIRFRCDATAIVTVRIHKIWLT